MNTRVPNLTFTVLSLSLLVAFTAAASERREITLDAERMEHDARLLDLRFDRAQNAIVLDDSELIEDDAPATGVPQRFGEQSRDWIEGLKKGVVIKKILLLDDPAAYSGRLVFHGNEVTGNRDSLHISVNGVEIIRPAARIAYPFAKQYIDYRNDRWIYVDLPVNALRKGKNEIRLWTNSETDSWYVLIAADEEFARGSLTRTRHPNRSLKSADGGKTWTDSRLGPKGSLDGEYSIRLSLDRHVKSGTYISSVMDIVNDASPLKRKVGITRASAAYNIEAPEGTTAHVLVRSGSSPRPDDASWTAWRSVGAGGALGDLGERRYFQWKAELSTTNPLVSPKLRKFRLSVEWEELSPNRKLGVAAKVLHNGHVARGSYPFGYENLLHPGLEKFRKDTRLDAVVEDAASEFDAMMRLLHWAYRIPITCDQYSWNWNDVVRLEPGADGKPRLQESYDGRRRDGMCLYSNQALIGALLAMGHHARHINIHSEGRAGHEIVEVWSNDFNKWIYMDATRDYYYFDPETGVPLNGLDLHNLMVPHVPRVETWRRPFIHEAERAVLDHVHVGIREGDNPASAVDDGRMFLARFGHFRITPRNDFLSHPVPVPVHTGATMWGWEGFLNYYDETFPKRWEYQRYSNRALDFYEPLNQAEVHLHETNERGVLEIAINTFTPGLDAYMVRINEQEWREQRQPKFPWTLTSGKNRIEARVRNVRGVLGPVSTLEVTYNP